MDNKYILTPDGNFISTDELYHHGVKGQRWGIRRYQNPDGTLTDRGKKRYLNPDGSLNKKGQKKFGDTVKGLTIRKKAKDMTDEELDRAIIRARKEDEYNRLRPEATSSATKKKSTLMNELVKPAVTDAGKKLVSKLMNEAVEKLTGGKVDKDSYEYLKKYYDKLKIKKDIDDIVNPKESWDDKLKKQQWEKNEREAAARSQKEAASSSTSTESSSNPGHGSSGSRSNRADSNSSRSSNSNNRSDRVYNADPISGSNSRRASNNNSRSGSSPIIDMYMGSAGVYSTRPVTDLTTSRNSSAGRDWASSYYNTPISGLLSAPKDDD